MSAGDVLFIGALVLLALVVVWFVECKRGWDGPFCSVVRGALDAEDALDSLDGAIHSVAGGIKHAATSTAHLFDETVGSSKSFGPPKNCPAGLEYYGGACYNPCPAGYHRTAALTCQKGQTWTSSKFGVDETCQSGLVDDAGLCYPACPPNYHGVGPLCWPNTYGRGAGIVPKPVSCSKTECRDTIDCGSGVGFFKHLFTKGCSGGIHCNTSCSSEQCWDTHSDNQAGLCYVPPKPGYYCDGPVCYANGPSSTPRGAGYVPGAPGPNGCNPGTEEYAGLCYNSCPAGYSRTAALTCSDFKVWTDAKFGIAKGGDVGQTNGPQCPEGQSLWGGLCYEPCPEGYYRTGPATCLKKDWNK